ncbi:hypothetical protein [Enterococcus ratti]|nr:hypothetical protein [Enterococcus ratti]
MKKKKRLEQMYLFFWFFPIFLLPFTWVNAVVQGAEVLGLVHGTGVVVLKNFPILTMFYFIISIGLVLTNKFINSYNWYLVHFSCMLIFTSFFSVLPRIIIGPNGLSESGLKDTIYSSMYFLTIKPGFYLAIFSFVLAIVFYFFSKIKINDEIVREI